MNGKIIYIEKLRQPFKHRVVIYDFDSHKYEKIKDVCGINGAFNTARNWQANTGYLIRFKSGQNLSRPTEEQIMTFDIKA